MILLQENREVCGHVLSALKNGLKLKLCMELVEEWVTPTPPRLEPIVPNSGNRLKTKPFTSPQSVS